MLHGSAAPRVIHARVEQLISRLAVTSRCSIAEPPHVRIQPFPDTDSAGLSANGSAKAQHVHGVEDVAVTNTSASVAIPPQYDSPSQYPISAE